MRRVILFSIMLFVSFAFLSANNRHTVTVKHQEPNLTTRVPVDIPAKTLATVIVNLKMYTVSVDYTVYAKFEDREVKFSGTWHGNVVQDPSTVSPEILVTYTPLNTTGGDTPIAGGN